MAAKTKPTEAPALITVRALEPLYENGERFAKGETFETTPERAESLGALVENAQ